MTAARLTEAEQRSLLVSTLRWTRRVIDETQESEDADPWLALEDIDARCADILLTLPVRVHDPATCALCDPEYDGMPNHHWPGEVAR